MLKIEISVTSETSKDEKNNSRTFETLPVFLVLFYVVINCSVTRCVYVKRNYQSFFTFLIHVKQRLLLI